MIVRTAGRPLLAAGTALLLAGCVGAPPRPPALQPPAAVLRPKPPAPAEAPPPAALLVERATAMVGQPYRYGGAAPGGFDCSGLVVYAAVGTGITVPRTTHEQLHLGVPVRRAELAAGDLVFMHLHGKVLHVGIAIDAHRFVHAPAKGRKVRIDSLDAPPYSKAYLAARRIVPTGPPGTRPSPVREPSPSHQTPPRILT